LFYEKTTEKMQSEPGLVERKDSLVKCGLLVSDDPQHQALFLLVREAILERFSIVCTASSFILERTIHCI